MRELAGTPADGGRLRRWGKIVAPFVLVVLVLARQALRDPPRQDVAFHRAHLAEGESAALAAELVEIPGYFYQDVSDEEIQGALAGR